MDKTQAEDNIKLIRQIMDRSARYTSFSGASGVIAGMLALLGCAATYWIAYNLSEDRQILPYVLTWVAVLLLALLQDFALAYRKAARHGESLFAPATFQVIKAVLPGIFVALVLSIRALTLGELDAIPAIWTLGYGAAVYAAGMYTVREVRIFGIIQLVTGAVGLFFFSQFDYSLYLLAVSFGLYHIVYGLWMTRKYGW
ncbi:MAG: hypothetical protein Q7T82_20295 [Armatimonadota bacterium]|nr:hypothetical protein [Armatimonadota bacterium]